MENVKQALYINEKDNVIMAIEPIAKGEIADAGSFKITAMEDIPRGHKIAIKDLSAGDPLMKYGKQVGRINADVKTGYWVHCHNVDDITEQLEVEAQDELMEKLRGVKADEIKPYRTAPKLSRDTIKAYRRPDGTMGIRNNIVVISIIQCANNAAQKIAQATGVPCITQEGGCVEFSDRLYHLVNSFICAGIHPNTYGVLVVSQGCQQTNPDWVIDPIRKSGREVHHLCLSKDGGFYAVVNEGQRLVRQMQARAALEQRVPCPISELVLSVHTGGSDWTSMLGSNPVCGAALDIHESIGGAIVATAGRGNQIDRCGSEETLQQMIDIGNRFRADCIIRNGQGLSKVNPTPGNKAGGLTTLEEKNCGTHQAHSHCLIRGFMELGDRPQGPGFWAIDQCHGNNDSYDCTGAAMAGTHFILFTTGLGSLVGNACAHTIKICANQETMQNMPECADFDASVYLWGEKSLEETAVALYERMLDYAEGELTNAELLGDFSWTIPHAKSLNGDYPAAPPSCPILEDF